MPVTDDGSPDYEFMENYMRRVEAEQLKQYREFVSICPPETIQPLSQKTWRAFRLLDYFDFIKGDQNDMSTLNEGNFPLVSAKDNNKRLNLLKIFLPVNDEGEPNFEYMEAFIRNIEATQYRKYLEYIGGD